MPGAGLGHSTCLYSNLRFRNVLNTPYYRLENMPLRNKVDCVISIHRKHIIMEAWRNAFIEAVVFKYDP